VTVALPARVFAAEDTRLARCNVAADSIEWSATVLQTTPDAGVTRLRSPPCSSRGSTAIPLARG